MGNPANSSFGNQILSDVPFYIEYKDGISLINTLYNSDGSYFNFSGAQMDLFIETSNGIFQASSAGGTPYITLLGAVINNFVIDVPQSIIAANFNQGDSFPFYLQLTDSLGNLTTLFKGTAYIN